MGDLVVRARELSFLAGALASAGRHLHEISDARRGLLSLVESSPSAALREAVERLLVAWELVVWDVGDELVELSLQARSTSEGFERVERSLRGGPFFEASAVLRR